MLKLAGMVVVMASAAAGVEGTAALSDQVTQASSNAGAPVTASRDTGTPGAAGAAAATSNDFLCGMDRVIIAADGHIRVNGSDRGDHKTTLLDAQNNYVHQFGDGLELRVTQYGRVAFRVKDVSRWASCKPLVFYAEPSA